MGFGDFIANVGKSLHLPELGISEAFGARNTYSGTLPNGQQWTGSGKTYQEAYNQALAYSKARTSAPTGGGDDPAPTGGYYGGGGSGGGGGTTSPNYDFLVNDQLARLDGQQQVGLDNILRNYNSAYATLTGQKTKAMRDFGIQEEQTQQDNVKAKNTIDQGVRTNITALSRLLGGRGAGNSSAATILAPYAAAVQGATQRSDVNDSYGRNMGAIKTARSDAEDQFENSFGQLSTDKGNSESALRAKIADTRAQLLAAKGDPNLQGRISELGRMVDQLGAVQAFTPKAVSIATPEMAAYNYQEATPDAAGNMAGGEGGLPGVGAYATLLGLAKKKQQQAGAAAVAPA